MDKDILSRRVKARKSGIEALGNPMLKSLVLPIESRETYFHENQASEFTDRLFDRQNAPYDTLNIWYQNKGENIEIHSPLFYPQQFKCLA